MRTQYPPLPGGPPEGSVVVGVGLDGAEAAIAFAAEEACLTRRPLHLLHVLRVSGAEAYAAVYDGAVEAADEALTRSLAVARERVAGRVPVTAERVDDGWLVADLVQRAERAHLLVLQHRRLSRWQRLVAGSTVSGVSARARVPVVSVPEDWTPRDEVAAVVTVGVQEPVEAEPLVRQALELARELDARVVVLHAWWLNGGYDSFVNDPEFRAEQEREAVESLRPALEAAREGFLDVPVTVDVRHAPPTRALLDASSDSLLVVLGRRHHRLPVGSHLGPVARAVLRDAAGPVLMHPDMPRETADEGGAGVRTEALA